MSDSHDAASLSLWAVDDVLLKSEGSILGSFSQSGHPHARKCLVWSYWCGRASIRNPCPRMNECDNDVVCKLIDATGSDTMNFTAQLSKHICLYTLQS